MTKGTTSQGPKNYKCHVLCRRCGKKSFHAQRNICSSCGFPEASMRQFRWGRKAIARRTQGCGRQSHLRTVWAKERNSVSTRIVTKSQKALNAFTSRRA